MSGGNLKVKAWIGAFRLRTLPLSLSCILMGTFLAAARGLFRFDICLLALLTTVLLQVLSNLANDYGDSIHGADSDQREGPSRAVQSGTISKQQMKKAMILFSILSLLAGLSLLYVSFKERLDYLLIFLGLGLMAIFAAINYTAGEKPYGYRGFGDIAVLIFFGFVGVSGTYFLYSLTLDTSVLLPAASCGLFATGVLNLNNIRDIESDELAGKYSIPVRLGRDRAAVYHLLLLSVGFVLSVIFTIISFAHFYQLLFLITLPLFVRNIWAVFTKTSPKELDPYLKQLAISTLLFVLTFGTGLLLANA